MQKRCLCFDWSFRVADLTVSPDLDEGWIFEATGSNPISSSVPSGLRGSEALKYKRSWRYRRSNPAQIGIRAR